MVSPYPIKNKYVMKLIANATPAPESLKMQYPNTQRGRAKMAINPISPRYVKEKYATPHKTAQHNTKRKIALMNPNSHKTVHHALISSHISFSSP